MAFIRAINGSPHNRIRMQTLAEVLTAAGCRGVSWHLHTGNIFLTDDDDRDTVAQRMRTAMEAHGLRAVDVMLRTPGEVIDLVARRPFAHLDHDAFQLEATFLGRPPANPDTTELTEQHGVVVGHIDPTVVCFAFPRGGRMQGGFNGWVEKRWKVPASSRAWNVVEAVAAKLSVG